MTEQPLIVLGAGGNSLGILDAVAAAREAGTARFRIEGILDDIPGNLGQSVLGHRVLGTIAQALRFEGCFFVNGISSVESFRKMPAIIERTKVPAERFATVVHPRAVVAQGARIGAGSAILAGSVVCSEAALGNHVIVLQNTTINHHSKVGDFATLSAGITVLGYVEIGRNAFISGGATLVPRIRIGESAVVGAGAVVLRDVAAGRVVAGNPARELETSRYNLA